MNKLLSTYFFSRYPLGVRPTPPGEGIFAGLLPLVVYGGTLEARGSSLRCSKMQPGALRILLVGDETNIHEAHGREYLASIHHHQVVGASNGEEDLWSTWTASVSTAPPWT